MMAYIEAKQYLYDRNNYFKTFWNYNDVLFVLINFTQFIIRCLHPGESINPDWDDKIGKNDDISSHVDRPLLLVNLILLASSSMKVLTILRVYEGIGNMVALLGACIKDISGFLSFFMIFIFFISAFYRLVGATFDDTDYEGIRLDFLVYMM